MKRWVAVCGANWVKASTAGVMLESKRIKGENALSGKKHDTESNELWIRQFSTILYRIILQRLAERHILAALIRDLFLYSDALTSDHRLTGST